MGSFWGNCTNLIVFVDRKASLGKRIRNLLSLSQVWWILIYAATIYVALPVLGAFWGTSYLQTRGFEKPAAALIISMIWVGLAVSSPLFGKISDLMHRRKPISVLCSLIGIVSSLLFLFTPSTNEYYLALLFFGIGIAGSGQGLSFAIMSEQVPSLKATALGLNNTAIMGFAALMPLVITSIISRYSENQEFTEIAFERGFVILPICFVISFLVAVFGIDETFCRQQNTVHHLETT
jgi:MFS family permease